MHISNWVPPGMREARAPLVGPQVGKPITFRNRPDHPVRVAAQSVLIIAVIVAMTFALLALLDRAGIQVQPTAEMMTID